MKIHFYPESDSQVYIDAAKEYQKIWNSEGTKIEEVTERIIGLKFKEHEINALIFEGVSNSYPLRMRASYPLEIKKATLIHELCDRILDGNGVEIVAEDKQLQNLEIHKQLSLVLYDIWVDLYGSDFAEQQVEVEKKRGAVYTEVWDWLKSFNTPEKRHEEFLKTKLGNH